MVVERPAALPVIPDAIPEELKVRNQWVNWGWSWKGDRWTKPPYQTNGNLAKSTDGGNPNPSASSTWTSFEDAMAAYQESRFDGIGYVLTQEDDHVGIDLDHCRDVLDGSLEPWAMTIVDRLDSYSEVSPSGTGLRIVAKGTLKHLKGNKKGGFEIYAHGRYLTITGHRLENTPTQIFERQQAIDAIHSEIFGPSKEPKRQSPTVNRANLPAGKSVQLSDSKLLEKARAAANGSKFALLWDGNTSGYGSDSEADLALCSLLGFWSLGDQDQMDRLFRQSGLYRDKWDERHSGDGRTYGELTVAKAVDRATFYQGATNGHRPVIPVEDIVNGGFHEVVGGGVKAKNATPILPDSVWVGWLKAYREWVEPTTDGAIEAMFAFASVDLSLGLGRNVAIHYGRPTWANLYVGAVGPTGVPRKSTIQERGNSIRRQTFPEDVVRVARSIGSGEGLLERFCNEGFEGEGKNARSLLLPIPGQRVLLDEPEFTNLLKKARRPGTANISEILLSLFDGNDIIPITRKRSIQVLEPFFCLATATTPESLEMALEDIDFDSGLIPRFAIFWCTPREPVAYPPAPDEQKLWHLATDLGAISQFAAELGAKQPWILLSPQAKSEWEMAYRELTERARDATKAAGAIMTRVPTMIMKWALLYTVQAGHSVIEVDDLARAMLVGDYLMQTAELVPGFVSKTPIARVEAKILEKLGKVRGKWMLVRDIHQMVSGRIKAQDLRQSLTALVELGRIEVGESPTSKKPVYRIC